MFPMTRLIDNRFPGKKLRCVAIVLIVLAVVAFITWWFVAAADRGMRAELLRQASVAAKAVDVERVKNLSGSEWDRDKPDYLYLKNQLAAMREANPEYRFLYLMGRKPDGSLFFFADSEPAMSRDYSPPGQVYHEPTADLLSLFNTREPVVEGPVADSWGVWVSALVPVTEPRTGALRAVLGMDIDARSWRRNIVLKAGPSVGIMLLLLLSAASLTEITVRRRAEKKLKAANRNLERATERAEKANAAKSQFLANISNEIRAPMEQIIDSSDVLMKTK